MSLADQARQENSPLCRFLDEYLPNRQVVARQWLDELGSRDVTGPTSKADRVGKAFELRVGLDLAGSPGRWPALEFLAPDDYKHVLEAAGFLPWPHSDDFPDTGTIDPLLRTWYRERRPGSLDSHERHTLRLLSIAAVADQLAHKLPDSYTVEQRRASLLPFRDKWFDPTVLDDLRALWTDYLATGREQLLGIGAEDHVLVSPVIVPAFATADLVVGSTLVDVKVSANHATEMAAWLDQVLGYWLLDRWNGLHIDRLGLYCARHTKVVSLSVDDILRKSTSRTVDIHTLREKLTERLRDDLEGAAKAETTRRYER